MISKQFASRAGCVQSFILAQKCRMRISEFWPLSQSLITTNFSPYVNKNLVVLNFTFI